MTSNFPPIIVNPYVCEESKCPNCGNPENIKKVCKNCGHEYKEKEYPTWKFIFWSISITSAFLWTFLTFSHWLIVSPDETLLSVLKEQMEFLFSLRIW